MNAEEHIQSIMDASQKEMDKKGEHLKGLILGNAILAIGAISAIGYDGRQALNTSLALIILGAIAFAFNIVKLIITNKKTVAYMVELLEYSLESIAPQPGPPTITTAPESWQEDKKERLKKEIAERDLAMQRLAQLKKDLIDRAKRDRARLHELQAGIDATMKLELRRRQAERNIDQMLLSIGSHRDAEGQASS